MPLLLSTILVVMVMVVGCAQTGRGPVSFHAPADWQVEHKSPGGFHYYRMTGKTPEEGLMILSQWPAPNKPEDIPALVQKLADGFREQAKKSSEFTLASEDYRVEEFAGEQCQGSFAIFQVAGGGTNTVQVLFMVSVSGRVWNGQFNGPPDSWKKALTVLKSIKRIG